MAVRNAVAIGSSRLNVVELGRVLARKLGRIDDRVEQRQPRPDDPRVGSQLDLVDVVVVGRPLRHDAFRRRQQAVGVARRGVREHDQAPEVARPQAIEVVGVDPDLLGPGDEPLVDLLAQRRVVADRARAEELRHRLLVPASSGSTSCARPPPRAARAERPRRRGAQAGGAGEDRGGRRRRPAPAASRPARAHGAPASGSAPASGRSGCDSSAPIRPDRLGAAGRSDTGDSNDIWPAPFHTSSWRRRSTRRQPPVTTPDRAARAADQAATLGPEAVSRMVQNKVHNR